MFFEQITTPGLGCFSYLIGCPLAGVMAVVDPKRDIEIYLEQAHKNGMKIKHIFETHVHADHVSGSRELSRATGADIHIHESASLGYPAIAVRHKDVFTLGAAHIRVLHTPGHTPNSISLVVTDTARSPEPQMILTGDLLFVGDTGRPDLPGEEIMQEQIRNLFDSLNSVLGGFADGLEVYPAHGQGSLCGSGMSAKPHSTLGYERIANPRLQLKDFEAFSESILGHLPMRPQSFSHIIATNFEGPPLLPLCEPEQPALSVAAVITLRNAGAVILDLRDSLSFAAAHIPGSLHVDATKAVAPNWIGTVVPPNSRLVLILSQDTDFGIRRTEMRRIGYDSVEGWLDGGMDAWIGKGLPVQNLSVLSVETFKERLAGAHPPQVIDVRTVQEHSLFNIANALHVTFETLLTGNTCLEGGHHEPVVVCQTGYRSAIAAALLQSRGCGEIGMLAGGLSAYRQSLV